MLAVAFAALFFAIPEPDHGHIAFLKTRTWLLEGAALAGAADDAGRARPLRAVVEPESGVVADYERIAREWARAQGRDVAGRPLELRVRVDERGFESVLYSQVAGEPGRTELGRVALARDASEAGSYYPDRLSLLPAFLAIGLAILTAKVIPSLLLGCLAGAFLHSGPISGTSYFLATTVWSRTLVNDFNLSIMLFVVFLFMGIGVMARSGGIEGMVRWVRRFARGPVSSQLCSYVIGILIFFDDYSNCIITGTTMRPLTDRNRVSREKLAYIVDSTAAPIAGLSVVSTWIAYEMSMFRDQLPEVTKPTGEPFAASASARARSEASSSASSSGSGGGGVNTQPSAHRPANAQAQAPLRPLPGDAGADSRVGDVRPRRRYGGSGRGSVGLGTRPNGDREPDA